MSWRISYWRKSTRVRTTTIDDSTQDEVASHLRRLATKQSDLEYLPSETDAPETVEIRSNRNGTMFWTTGRDFHYTAEWFLDKRKPDR
jgi:hypothetical protein